MDVAKILHNTNDIMKQNPRGRRDSVERFDRLENLNLLMWKIIKRENFAIVNAFAIRTLHRHFSNDTEGEKKKSSDDELMTRVRASRKV